VVHPVVLSRSDDQRNPVGEKQKARSSFEAGLFV
jgi:hypothetical protein